MSDYLYTDELEKELADLQEREELIEAGEAEENELDDEDRERLTVLTELFEEIGTGLSETLIPDDEFVSYAQQLAEDISGASSFEGWPFNLIDWDEAADALKQDYEEVYFDGTTYFYHA